MEKSSIPELCLRTITVRAAEQFKITRDEFETSLHGQWATIQNLIASFSSAIMNLTFAEQETAIKKEHVKKQNKKPI